MAFGLVEAVYANTATAGNFTMFGGTLLTQICEGILTNETIVSLFSSLYDGGADCKTFEICLRQIH